MSHEDLRVQNVSVVTHILPGGLRYLTRSQRVGELQLVERNILTIDVPPEKRGTGRNFRYTVNETRARRLLAELESTLLGR